MGTSTLPNDLSDLCKPSEDKSAEKSVGSLDDIIGDVSQEELPRKVQLPTAKAKPTEEVSPVSPDT